MCCALTAYSNLYYYCTYAKKTPTKKLEQKYIFIYKPWHTFSVFILHFFFILNIVNSNEDLRQLKLVDTVSSTQIIFTQHLILNKYKDPVF